MQTLTKRPARKLEDGGIGRFDPRRITPGKIQLREEWDDEKGPSRIHLSVIGLTVKITAGFSWFYKLLAGPPMSQRDRYSFTVAQVQKHKGRAACWVQQPTRGFF